MNTVAAGGEGEREGEERSKKRSAKRGTSVKGSTSPARGM